VVTTLDGQPEEITRVSGPSLFPFLASVGVIITFIGEIFHLSYVSLAGLIFALAMIVGWHWPEKVDVTDAEIERFEKAHGIPVRLHGSYAVARWSLVLSVMIIGIALLTLLFSYFYLRLENPVWPPAGVERPGLALAITAAVLIAAAAGVSYWALRRIQANAQGSLRLGLGLAFILALAGLVIQIYDYTRFTFGMGEHAYGSIVYVMGGIMWVLVVAGLVMLAISLLGAMRSQFSDRTYLPVINTAQYWISIALAWWVVYGVLYLAPYLI